MNRRIWLLVVVHVVAGIAFSGWAALEGDIPFVFDYILLVPPFALTFCQSGLLAFWAAMSRQAIWKRTAGLFAGVIALEILLALAINYDEYRYMPSTTTGLVAAAMVIVRVWRAELTSTSGQPSNRQALQFSIRGLLLLTLVVAVLVTVGKQMRLAGWSGPTLLTKCVWAAYFAVTNVAGIWAAMGLGAPRLKSVAVTVLSVPMALAFGWCLGIEGDDWFYVTTIMVLETVLLLVSLLVVRSCGYRLVPYPTSQRIEPQQDASDKGAA